MRVHHYLESYVRDFLTEREEKENSYRSEKGGKKEFYNYIILDYVRGKMNIIVVDKINIVYKLLFKRRNFYRRRIYRSASHGMVGGGE